MCVVFPEWHYITGWPNLLYSGYYWLNIFTYTFILPLWMCLNSWGENLTWSMLMTALVCLPVLQLRASDSVQPWQRIFLGLKWASSYMICLDLYFNVFLRVNLLWPSGDSCVCVCVCVWCSGYVLGSGPQVPEFKPNSGIFSIWFSICLLPAPPVYPAMIRNLAFAGMKIQGLFSWSSNGPGGTSGAHTTCCEERPVLLRVPSLAPGVLLARLTVPA